MATTVLDGHAGADRKQIVLPKAISADSHTIEPPEAYSKHIDPAYRDRAPTLVHDDIKGDCFKIDGMPALISAITVSSCGKVSRAIKNPDGKLSFVLEDRPPPHPDGAYSEGWNKGPTRSLGSLTFADTPLGGWQVPPRLEAQDRDGVMAEILYPTVGMVLCNHPDTAYQAACFRAYNLWLQELVSEAPTRLFGIGQTALRSIDEGIEDFRRIKEMGFVGVMLPGAPEIEGDWHDPIFDPLWECAQALDLPVSFHTLASSRDKQASPKRMALSMKAMNVDFALETLRANQDVIASFVLGQVFVRFPRLKLVCVEAGAGWIPDYLNRMDHFYEMRGPLYKIAESPHMPSHYFLENVYVTFQDDHVALSLTHQMNSKRLLWANDYPHSDATWPWSRNLMAEQMKALSEDERRWIMHDNVKELYNLPVV
jgi:predicted TIM-barrel fold metal-dependent hydrolase